MSPAAPRRFRWSRALIHIVFVVLVVNAIALAVTALAGSVDARKMGQLVGGMLPEILLFTVVASFGKQTGRPVVFALGALVTAALGIGWIPFFVIALQHGHERHHLTAPETAAFERREGKLCQPALGIGLADPGDAFEPDPERARSLNQALAKQEGLHAWVWTSRRPGQAGRLIVQIIKGFGDDGREFSQFVAGLGREVATREAIVDAETTNSRSKPYRYRLELRRQGAAVDLDCISAQESNPMPLIVCAETVATDHAALRAVRESLVISGCR